MKGIKPDIPIANIEALLWRLSQQFVAPTPQLSYLSLDTTGACDLSCSMCYYDPKIDLSKGFIPLGVLKDRIQEAYSQLGLRCLVFSGKEPLLNLERLKTLVLWARNTFNSNLTLGLITNGVILNKKFEQILATGLLHALDFVDVSIDSIEPNEHDQIRGRQGSLMHTLSSLQKLNKFLPGKRIGSASVLFQHNSEALLHFIKDYMGENKHFFFSPVQPPPGSEIESPSPNLILSFIRQIKHLLGAEARQRELEITIMLLGINTFDLMENGVFGKEDIKIDDNDQLYVEFEIGSNKLILILQIVPETSWKVAKITYDGWYLPNTHFLQTPHPQAYAVGNIANTTMVDLYNSSIASTSILKQILDAREQHECKNRECWSTCLGGFAGSEHNLIRNQSLAVKPYLCRR